MENQIYHYCIDCGCRKEPNIFRNCKSCMDKVHQHTKFRECQRCHKPKNPSIWGVCKECEQIIAQLNNRARWNR